MPKTMDLSNALKTHPGKPFGLTKSLPQEPASLAFLKDSADSPPIRGTSSISREARAETIVEWC
jgi:hypothetical protein